MSEYVILTDSASDLPDKYAVSNNLVVLPLKFYFNSQEYYNYLDFSQMSAKEFYQMLRENNYAKTSQVNVADFKKAFTEILKEGKDIVAVLLSSGLSGTFNSAEVAKEEVLKKFPDRQIYLVDSKTGSLGEGLVVNEAVQFKKAGKTCEETYRHLKQFKYHVASLFTHDDLTHLKKGGRIGIFTYWLGTALRIKPIITADNEGKLNPRTKVLGRKKSLRNLAERVIETYDSNFGNTIYISHADCEEEALQVKTEIENRLNLKVSLVHMMGPVIGAHGGPGTVAVFYPVKER
ncbi:MAG: DegV family protein [Acholeplasmataceae bacterium]|jgi:DegV family protein with EDD domain|nr:DegV family protein [Acholeplasmataceae bacterium]